MKNTIITNKTINIKCYIAFSKFIATNDDKQLIKDLFDIENILINGKQTNKNLWFRFDGNDTLVWTIKDIHIKLFNPYNFDSLSLIKMLIISSLNNVSLIVNFS